MMRTLPWKVIERNAPSKAAVHAAIRTLLEILEVRARETREREAAA